MAMQMEDEPVLIESLAAPIKVFEVWRDRIANIYETESGSSRIIPMEGVRGWAVLLVFFVHFNTAFSKYVISGSPLFHVSEFLGTVGATGVDLFFVISGYLIYGAVIRSKFNYRRFLRRRVQRIYPTFLFIFLIYIGLWAFSSDENFKFHGTIGEKAAYITQNLLLMPGIFRVRAMIIVAWSLSYEMFFYLLLPLVVALTGMRRSSRAFRVSFFLALIAAGVLISPLMAHPHVRLIGFLFGIILFEVADVFRSRSSNIKDLMVLGAYLCGLGLIFAIDTASTVPESIVLPLTSVIAGVASFLFCGFCFHGGGLLSRALSWRPLRALGNMSYSFYLFHGLAIGVVKQTVHRFIQPGDHNLAFLGMLVAALAVSWIVSSLVFIAIERPLSIDVGRKQVRPSLPAVVAS
jgi:peptidoglycan/LPS O-acetylase OafA/YrhL